MLCRCSPVMGRSAAVSFLRVNSASSGSFLVFRERPLAFHTRDGMVGGELQKDATCEEDDGERESIGSMRLALRR